MSSCHLWCVVSCCSWVLPNFGVIADESSQPDVPLCRSFQRQYLFAKEMAEIPAIGMSKQVLALRSGHAYLFKEGGRDKFHKTDASAVKCLEVHLWRERTFPLLSLLHRSAVGFQKARWKATRFTQPSCDMIMGPCLEARCCFNGFQLGSKVLNFTRSDAADHKYPFFPLLYVWNATET